MARLILLRHGESVWNQLNLFTGWVDVPLTEKGIDQAIAAGVKLKDMPIDAIYTSTLVRAQETLVLAMAQHRLGKVPVFMHSGEGQLERWGRIYSEKAEQEIIPVYRASQLNERMYGALQGLNKADTAKKYGAEQVKIWRRSFDVAPPEGESLADCAARTLPYFQKMILPELDAEKNILISAHGNSLRSIIMSLDRLSKDEVVHLEITLGEPIIYTYSAGIFRKEL